MTSFPPSFFDQLEDRLSLATFDTNQQFRRISKMNIRLRDLIQSREKTTIPPVEMIPAPIERKSTMSITGLQSGAFKSLLAEMKQEIAAAQNQGIADVKAAKDAAAEQIKTTISGVKAKVQSEVSDALQEFAEFTNGGPV